MRFLIDNALSPDVAVALVQAGHDAVHISVYGLSAADDTIVLNRAAVEKRVLVSADSDFGTLLALRRDTEPSIILFRKGAPHRPSLQAQVLLANLVSLEESLNKGCVVIIEKTRIRIRMLPIGGEE